MSAATDPKVVFITGAASGIGLACARTLLQAGARVVLIDRAEDALTLVNTPGPENFRKLSGMAPNVALATGGAGRAS